MKEGEYTHTGTKSSQEPRNAKVIYPATVTPGAMFYWIQVNHSGGLLTVNADQVTGFSKEFTALAVKLWDAGCARVDDVSFRVTGGDATLTADLPAGTYYMRVRYAPKSLRGVAIEEGATPVFDFLASVNGVTTDDSLTLVPKP